MPDLRTLSAEARQRLMQDTERRARIGEAPAETRAALGLSPSTYHRWAKTLGFRQCDLPPNAALDRPDITAPPSAALEPAETLASATSVLASVRAALAKGDHASAEKLISAWRAKKRRAQHLAALETDAATERAEAAASDTALSNADLAAELSRLLGRHVEVRGTG
ncbi:MAG: hypothetical protein AAF582_05505 [Pseudomonadota bacterium]